MSASPTHMSADDQEMHLMVVRLFTVAELLLDPTPKEHSERSAIDIDPSETLHISSQKSRDSQADV